MGFTSPHLKDYFRFGLRRKFNLNINVLYANNIDYDVQHNIYTEDEEEEKAFEYIDNI